MLSDVALTEQFLRAVSNRLSGRSDCKQLEYVVCIGMIDDSIPHQIHVSEYGDISSKIFFFPSRRVYIDRHHKQPEDLQDIVSLILQTKFADTIFLEEDETGVPKFREGSLVRGVYKYELSLNKLKRHWIRVL